MLQNIIISLNTTLGHFSRLHKDVVDTVPRRVNEERLGKGMVILETNKEKILKLYKNKIFKNKTQYNSN